MDERIKTKWVAKLRDPETRQVRNALKTDLGYCCLGVLCEIAVDEGVIEPGIKNNIGNYRFGEHQNADVLPFEVASWAGLGDQNPIIYIEGTSRPASQWNDLEKSSFNYIADGIEQSL